MPTPKPRRGGSRSGTGRPPRAEGPATHRVTVWLTESEAAELSDATREGETMSSLLRDSALHVARGRNASEEAEREMDRRDDRD